MKNQKKVYFTIMLFLLLILLLLVYSYMEKNKKIQYSENINAESNFCMDSDGDLSLLEQNKKEGYVFILHKNERCDWSQINKFNNSHNICAFSLTYNDYCMNNTLLKERTCENNKVNSKIIICKNLCQNGKCT